MRVDPICAPHRTALLAAAVALSIGGANAAHAQAQSEIAPETLREQALAKPSEERPDGWKLKLKVGGTASFNHSRNVVGAENGATVQLGLFLESGAHMKAGAHEWQTDVAIQHAQSLTPSIDSFVKTVDNADLTSLYLYRISPLPWLGPYGRFRLSTQLLDGYTVRTTRVEVQRTDRKDRTLAPVPVDAKERIDLTNPFEPLLLFESAGVFAHPIEKDAFTLKTKLGLALQHIVIQDGYTLAGEGTAADGTTPLLQLRQLQGSSALGGELDLDLSGIIVPEVVNWKAKVNFYMPFHSTLPVAATGTEALNTVLAAGISVKLAKWASLDYVLNVKRIPLVLREWQVQNGVILTAGFDIL
jgi:hypothetical protein